MEQRVYSILEVYRKCEMLFDWPGLVFAQHVAQCSPSLEQENFGKIC